MVSTRTIAVVLVLVGAAAFAFPTFASEGFKTERPTSFRIGSEDDALIGSEETGKEVTHPGKGPRTVTVGRLINNFDSELSLDYRATTDDPAIKVDTESNSGPLQPGDSADITAQCRGSGGQGTAVVTATVTSAYGDGVGVENAEFDFTVEYDCSPPKKSSNSGGENAGQGPADDDDDDDDNDDDDNDDDGDDDDDDNDDDDDDNDDDDNDDDDDDDDDD